MIGLRRLEQFQSAIETAVADGVPGDIMETGVWRGGACIIARATLRALGIPDRSVWLADSFCGLPPPDGERFPADLADAHHTEDFLRVSRQEVEVNFRKYGLRDAQVHFLEGWFRDTLPNAPVDRLCVLRLDGDMYESTMIALENLHDRVSPGGFIIVDDYGESRAAVRQWTISAAFAASLPNSFRLIGPATTGECLIRGRPGLQRGDSAVTLDIWRGYASPEAERLTELAQEALGSGDHARCEELALRALAVDGNALPAHLVLSRVRNPGPDYLAHLQWIHEHVRPSVYLEIGVFKGDSIRLATADCRVIGVDPQPLIAATDSLTLFATTSDDFFTNGAADRVEAARFRFRLHRWRALFEQILRDFVHIEQYAAAGALLALHDTLPLDEMTSARTRRTTFYSGASWKLLAVLRDLRPDLRVQSIPTAPTGLTIVEGSRPRPTSWRVDMTRW